MFPITSMKRNVRPAGGSSSSSCSARSLKSSRVLAAAMLAKCVGELVFHTSPPE